MNEISATGPNQSIGPKRPFVLCILDGWGERADATANAIALARKPNWDRLIARCPHALLRASADEVGLPHGQMGNSEVGHMNMGAGRIVLQGLPRIDAVIQDNRLACEPSIVALVEKLKRTGGAAHVLGLMSPGGVHSHQDHIVALARVLADQGIRAWVHAFLDGRDTPPRSAIGYLRQFQAALDDCPLVRIGSVAGRYWAMDRDQRWERTERAYRMLVDAQGARAKTALTAVEDNYAGQVTDEFVAPTAIDDYPGMRDGDGVVMANFRADRARQILGALVDPDFTGFARPRVVSFAAALGMVVYSTALSRFFDTLFPTVEVKGTLGEAVAKAGRTQLRLAETEKYAHVTFFLNGGVETVYPGEERILVPSPKVATYDLKPEMSAFEVADHAVAALRARRFDLIVINFANTDMVGHTGDLAAATAAVEAVDRCLGLIVAALESVSGVMLITADHGNAEQMRDDATGQAHTAHTLNPVPLIVIGAAAGSGLRDGRLADVAPTILTLMGIPVPAEMTGAILIESPSQAGRKRAERRAPA